LGPPLPFPLTRLIWALGAIYFSCAAIRLARFNVSNAHGEQHHFSFLGLPSPGAGGAVVGLILMQQELLALEWFFLAKACAIILPAVVLATGLLMVSKIRYPHLVNRYLRGKRSIGRLVAVLGMLLLVIVAHRFAIGIGTLSYAMWGPLSWAWAKSKARAHPIG
jgi:CDP-diacylglycerol--serine O-phosphatidyltransferase